MDRLTDFLFRHSRLVVAGWVLFTLVAGGFAVGLEGRAVPGGEASASSDSELVARELSANDVPGLFVVVTGEAAQNEGAQRLAAIRGRIAEVGGVQRVAELPLPPPNAAAGPVTVLGITAEGGVDGAIDVANQLLHEDDLAPPGSQAFLGGYGAHREELVQLSRSDLLRAEQVGLPIVLVVLLLTFGSLWATLVPLTIGLSALVGGLGTAGALAFGIPFSEYVTNAASMIGLALAVDYAMFLVQRVRECLLHGMDVEESVREAMRTTGEAIAWSGLTVVLALSTMFLVDSRSMRTAGLGMILVTVAAMATALLCGPIVIRALGHRLLPRHDRLRIERGLLVTIPGQRRSRREMAGFWARWGTRVTDRPVLWLAAGLAVLGALCVPALNLAEKVDLPSASMMPSDSDVRQATEIASLAYGPGVLAPLEIVVDGSEVDAGQLAAALEENPEVISAAVLPLNGENRYRVSVATVHAPSDHLTRDLVRSLRDVPLVGVSYQIGGEAAAREDATEALFESLPLMLCVLLVLVFGLLVLAMRSIVLPLKAILLVLISLGATAGGLVLLSTTDLGASLIGWSEPADLHPIVPITIVAVVIALSTDYEVILISRIAEHYQRGRDNTTAIVYGVARTGRVISSAAAIMIAVFFGFALSDVTPLKQLGVGLAIAVAIDATLIRGVLVPASMRLMGHWNWWLPALFTSPSSEERPHPDAPAPAEPDLGHPDHDGEEFRPAPGTVLPHRPRRVWTR